MAYLHIKSQQKLCKMKTNIQVIETENGKEIFADNRRISLDAWDRKAMVEAGLNQYSTEDIATYLEWKEVGERHISL